MKKQESTRKIGIFFAMIIVLAIIPPSAVSVEIDECEQCWLGPVICNEEVCENITGCNFCNEDRNCDQFCPCKSDCSEQSGYEGKCAFDIDCSGNLLCTGPKTGRLSDQACCNAGEIWDPVAGSCGNIISLDEISEDIEDIINSGSGGGQWVGYTPPNFNFPIGANISVWGGPGSGGYGGYICIPDDIEICDGLDNDCNGLVDDAPGCSRHYGEECLLKVDCCDQLEGCELECKREDYVYVPPRQGSWQHVQQEMPIQLCCYSHEEIVNGVCKDTRLLENQEDCDRDDQCRSTQDLPLHCSLSESDGNWFKAIFGSGDFTDDYCCAIGEEYNTPSKGCAECGTYIEEGDGGFCAEKTENGCSCMEGEGDCENDGECYAGMYCQQFGWWGTDRCCPKGTVYDKDKKKCVNSRINLACQEAEDANTCHAIGPGCCFDPETDECGYCKSLRHNQVGCIDDNSCCDRDNDCDETVDLHCNNDGMIGANVCCYPWETQSGISGRCIIKDPTGDPDEDWYATEIEVRYGSNPLIDGDTPFWRMNSDQCNWFLPKLSAVYLTEQAIRLMLTFVQPYLLAVPTSLDAIGARPIGLLFGVGAGALMGLVDDIHGLIGLVKLVGKAIGWFINVFSTLVNRPDRLAEQVGYSLGNAWEGISYFFTHLGDIGKSLLTSSFDAISLRGEAINFLFKNDECQSQIYTRAFTEGYLVGWVVEQILLMKGISQIMKGAKVQAFLKPIKQLKAVQAMGKIAKGFSKPFEWALNKIGKGLNIFLSWRRQVLDALFDFFRIHGDEFFTKYFGKFSLSEMHDFGRRTANLKKSLIADFGDDLATRKLTAVLDSKVGRMSIRQGWSIKARRVVADLASDPNFGNFKLNKFLYEMGGEKAGPSVARKITAIANEVSEGAAAMVIMQPDAVDAFKHLTAAELVITAKAMGYVMGTDFPFGFRNFEHFREFSQAVTDEVEKIGIRNSEIMVHGSSTTTPPPLIPKDVDMHILVNADEFDRLGKIILENTYPDTRRYRDIEKMIANGRLERHYLIRLDPNAPVTFKQKMINLEPMVGREIDIALIRKGSSFQLGNNNYIPLTTGRAEVYSSVIEVFVDEDAYVSAFKLGNYETRTIQKSYLRDFVQRKSGHNTEIIAGLTGSIDNKKTGAKYFVKTSPDLADEAKHIQAVHFVERREVELTVLHEDSIIYSGSRKVKPINGYKVDSFTIDTDLYGKTQRNLLLTDYIDGDDMLVRTQQKLGSGTITISNDNIIGYNIMTKQQIEAVENHFLLDYWRSNWDRTTQNIYISSNGYVVFIDNEFALEVDYLIDKIDFDDIFAIGSEVPNQFGVNVKKFSIYADVNPIYRNLAQEFNEKGAVVAFEKMRGSATYIKNVKKSLLTDLYGTERANLLWQRRQQILDAFKNAGVDI